MKDNIKFLFPKGYDDLIKEFIFDEINFKIFKRKNNKQKKIQRSGNKLFFEYRKKVLKVNRLFYLYYNKTLPEIVTYKNGNIFDLSKDNLIGDSLINHRKKLMEIMINFSKSRKKDPFVVLMRNLRKGGERVNSNGERIKSNSNSRKKALGISKSLLKKIFKMQDERCYWLGVKLNPEANLEANHPLALSIDRIDNDKGYNINNIVISSRLANLGRGCYSADKMKIICKNLKDQIKNDS